MPGVIRAICTLETDTALPQDSAVNVFHFQGPVPDDIDAHTQVHNMLQTFYGDIGSVLSSLLTGGGTIKSYALDDPEPRSPVLETDITGVTTGVGKALPQEVALCLSFQGVKVSGEPQARKRGRVFIGPLDDDTNRADNARPFSTAINTIKDAAGDLLVASNTGFPVPWAVYSRVNDIAYHVDNGWLDDAWDTQRRRGVAPTTRTLF